MKKSTKSGGSKLTAKTSTSAAKSTLSPASRREQLGKRGGDLARFAQPLKAKVVPTPAASPDTSSTPAST